MFRLAILRILPIIVLFLMFGGICRAYGQQIVVARILNTPIMPPTRDYLIRALKKAENEHAACLLVEMDTPGGLGESMREIAQAFLESSVPVVVYVTPETARAASAGAVIALSANIIAMAPGTNIGAAHPVTGEGGNLPSDIREKITNDMAAFVRNIAIKRGKNPTLAEDFVRKSISLTANEAFQSKLVDIIANNRQDLFRQLNGRKVQTAVGMVTMDTSNPSVQDFPLSSLESFLLFLFNPNIALILAAIAFYGLVTEFTNPGVILPGVAGGIALILSLYSMAALDVNAAGAALLILALILFVTDVYATAHGVLTAGGVICFVAGSLMLFNNSFTGVPVSLSLIITLALVTAGFSLGILGAAIRQRRRPAGSGPEKLIGSAAIARTSLVKEGKVFADGALWTAVNIGEHPIKEGEEVIIVQREKLKLLVRLKGQSDNRKSSS